MVGVAIHVFGDEATRRRLVGVGERGRDFKPIFALIAADFYRIEREQFDTEGARGPGGSWEPLSPRRVAYKARHGLDPRILRAQGDLMASLTGPTDEASIHEVTATNLRLGSRDDLAEIHTKGLGPNLPKRPVIGVTRNDRADWKRALERWVIRGEVAL